MGSADRVWGLELGGLGRKVSRLGAGFFRAVSTLGLSRMGEVGWEASQLKLASEEWIYLRLCA